MADLALSGLASGVDTTSIVEQLMTIERQKSSRVQLRQKGVQSQQTTLKDLKSKLDALKSAATDLRSASTWGETQTVESSDAARVTATRTGGAPIGGYSVQVQSLASSAQKSYTWTESATAGTLTLDDADGATSAIALDIVAGAKIGDVAAQINGRSDLPVYAAVVGGTKLVLSSRATGAAADFSATSSQLGAPTGAVAGRDASYLLDGETTPRTSATNVVEDAIPGVRLAFKGVTAAPVSVAVSAPGIDRDKIKTQVKEFVEAYNALATATRETVSEKKVVDATTQAAALKGQLFGDTGLTSMLSKLRIGMSAQYTGVGNTTALDDLGDIGISFGKPGGSTADAKAGLLQLDEAKLTAALESDAQGVRRLFGGTATAAFAQDVEKAADSLSDMLDGRIASAGRQEKRLGDELTRVDRRLEAKEKRLKAQFAAMESAMSAAQTQQEWLAGQLSALSTS